MLNYRYSSITETNLQKMSEEEHCYTFLYPILRPFFSGEKQYKFVLNRANLGKERPDLSCMMNSIPILNSEFKPVGCTSSQKNKDYIKVHIKGQKSINQQIRENSGPGEAIIFLNMGMYYKEGYIKVYYRFIY